MKAGAAGSPDHIKDLLAMGYRFLSIGADVVAMGNYCRQLMKAVGANPAAVPAGVYGKA